MKKPLKLLILLLLIFISSYSQQKNYTVLRNGENGMIARAITFDENLTSFSSPEKFMKQTFNLPSYSGVKILDITNDNLNYVHYRLQQTIHNIPIEGSMYLVHVKKGNVTYANGEWFFEIPTSLKTKNNSNNILTSEQALKKAKQEVKAEKYAWEIGKKNTQSESYFMGEKVSSKGELVYITKQNSLNSQELKLAYKFDMYAISPLRRFNVFIDVNNGHTLFKEQKIHSANGTTNTGFYGQKNITVTQSGSTYYSAQNGARKVAMKNMNGAQLNFQNEPTNSSYITSSSSNFNFSGNNAYYMSAYWGMEQTWDMFKNVFNRSSYDGQGSQINLYVNGGGQSASNNAFWSGTWTYFGNGTNGAPPLTPIDVVAHEIGHGVTGTTSNLVYQGQSGALNESFSDMFGTYIEYYVFNNLNQDVWTMGDKISLKRSMSNPNQHKQPDTYGGTHWFNTNNCRPQQNNDQCGVHINSGITNFWFYLISQGGQGTNDIGNSYSVNAIGIEKAGQIAYRTLVNYLSANSDFSAARNAAIRAASDLYGSSSCEVKSVTNAMYAVGIGQQYSGNSDCGNGDGGGGSNSCDGVREYVEGQNYQIGDRITYQGDLYERTASGWENIGECSSTTPNNPCDGVSEYVEGQNYQIGDRIIYQGDLYERTASGWENIGECSSTTPTDPCSGVSEYNPGQNYQTGDRITYQGSLFELSATGDWNNIGTCSSFSNYISQIPSSNKYDDIIISKNPVENGILTIKTNSLDRKEYLIYNTSGKVLDKGTFTNQINIRHLQNGLYFLKTTDKTLRFINNNK